MTGGGCGRLAVPAGRAVPTGLAVPAGLVRARLSVTTGLGIRVARNRLLRRLVTWRLAHSDIPPEFASDITTLNTRGLSITRPPRPRSPASSIQRSPELSPC
ncbi:hypothetical protein GCM10010394_25830 [Streptomyces crystallinus]|uniref:Uncharacterized protein n=1 Tax=Streptomyces crystallinus TaxID=68191 RepID=A0ABP3QQ52_9ACTN